MLKKAVVYWIHYSDHVDPFSEGYIGVTVNPKVRFDSHRDNKQRPQIYNRIRNGAKIEVLHSDVDEELAYTLEKQYRPGSNIGWNIKPGGQLIAREQRFGKSTKRTPVTFFGITYESVTSALKELGISTSLYYFMKNNDCSKCNTIDEVRAYSWAERSKKLSARKVSDETKSKMRNSHFGIRPNAESRRKMSASQKRRFSRV